MGLQRWKLGRVELYGEGLSQWSCGAAEGGKG